MYMFSGRYCIFCASYVMQGIFSQLVTGNFGRLDSAKNQPKFLNFDVSVNKTRTARDRAISLVVDL